MPWLVLGNFVLQEILALELKETTKYMNMCLLYIFLYTVWKRELLIKVLIEIEAGKKKHSLKSKAPIFTIKVHKVKWENKRQEIFDVRTHIDFSSENRILFFSYLPHL